MLAGWLGFFGGNYRLSFYILYITIDFSFYITAEKYSKSKHMLNNFQINSLCRLKIHCYCVLSCLICFC